MGLPGIQLRDLHHLQSTLTFTENYHVPGPILNTLSKLFNPPSISLLGIVIAPIISLGDKAALMVTADIMLAVCGQALCSKDYLIQFLPPHKV